MGRPFYKATGQFMAYNIAAMWWFTDFILVPVVENVTPDIYKDAASEE